MSVSINEATGEVTVELGGNVFRLFCSMARQGELERALGVDGLPGVNEKLSKQSADVVLIALKTLCVSGNEALLDDLSFGRNIAPAIRALLATIFAALPEERGRGNARAAAVVKNGQHRGRDTGKSLSAS